MSIGPGLTPSGGGKLLSLPSGILHINSYGSRAGRYDLTRLRLISITSLRHREPFRLARDSLVYGCVGFVQSESGHFPDVAIIRIEKNQPLPPLHGIYRHVVEREGQH